MAIPGAWRDLASCRRWPGRDVWFAKGKADQAIAVSVCLGCPVRAQCLADALELERQASGRTLHGVRGGRTARERARTIALERQRHRVDAVFASLRDGE